MDVTTKMTIIKLKRKINSTAFVSMYVPQQGHGSMYTIKLTLDEVMHFLLTAPNLAHTSHQISSGKVRPQVGTLILGECIIRRRGTNKYTKTVQSYMQQRIQVTQLHI